MYACWFCLCVSWCSPVDVFVPITRGQPACFWFAAASLHPCAWILSSLTTPKATAKMCLWYSPGQDEDRARLRPDHPHPPAGVQKKKEQQPTAQQLSLSYLSSPSHTRQIHFSLRAVGYANVQSQPCLLPFRLCDPRVCLRLSKCGA